MLAKSFDEKAPHPTGPRKILPPVKFSGQQPGEEIAELDTQPEDRPGNDSHDIETDEKMDERGLPKGEPSTEGKFSG
jgi:hypothetical protein